MDKNQIVPFLMFNSQAEEAVDYYATVFSNAEISGKRYYSADVPELGGKLMSAEININGQLIYVSNGGSYFSFTEGFSLMVKCSSQQEIDYYWEKLSDGGMEQPCGWLKDRFGISWQIIPYDLVEMLTDTDSEKANRTMQSMFSMKKLDVEIIRRAYKGL